MIFFKYSMSLSLGQFKPEIVRGKKDWTLRLGHACFDYIYFKHWMKQQWCRGALCLQELGQVNRYLQGPNSHVVIAQYEKGRDLAIHLSLKIE